MPWRPGRLKTGNVWLKLWLPTTVGDAEAAAIIGATGLNDPRAFESLGRAVRAVPYVEDVGLGAHCTPSQSGVCALAV